MEKLKYKIWIITLLCAGTLLTSCENWLDVRPSSEIKEEDMFSTERGFRQALFGVYTGMSASKIYGGNLSMSFLDVLAQNYVIKSEHKPFYRDSRYEYENIGVESRINSIWSGMYNQIVNCNNILENLEGNEHLFVDDNYKFFLAETKALRAFLHFDLLRMFGPSIASGGGDEPAIPFVHKVQNTPFPQLTVNEMLDTLVSELKECKNLLKKVDPIGPEFDEYLDSESTWNVDKNIYMDDDGFLMFRKSRMNYYAINALMARIYLYKGDKEKALAEAKEVIESNRFKWVDIDKDILGLGRSDMIFYNEIIFNLYNDNLIQKSNKYFKTQALEELYIPETRRSAYFPYSQGEGGDSDYRYRYHFNNKGGVLEFISKYDYDDMDAKYIPMIRLSEMCYIAAECEPNSVKALEYLNLVRENRGYAKENSIKDPASLEDELYKEYRKEFLAEGQMFYYLKRKNIQNIEFSEIQGNNAVYVLPIPDSEIDFGNIKK